METLTSKTLAKPPGEPPTPSKAQRQAERKSLRYDKATIQAEVATLRSANTTIAQKEQARQAISATVLRTTGLRADSNSVKAVSELTSALLGDGNIGLFGIEEAIKMAAPRIDVPAAEIEHILAWPAIISRLNKLV